MWFSLCVKSQFNNSSHKKRWMPLSWQLAPYFLSPPFLRSHTHSCHKSHGRTGPNHLHGESAENCNFIKLSSLSWLVLDCTWILKFLIYKRYVVCRVEISSWWLVGTQLGKVWIPFPDNGLFLTLPCWIELAPGSLAAGLPRKVFIVFRLHPVVAVLTLF